MRGMCALLCVCFVFRGGFHSFGGGCLFGGNETSVRGFIRWTIRRFFSDPCSRISLPLVISSLVSIKFFHLNKFNLPKKYLKVSGKLFKLHFQVPEMVEITPFYGTPTQKKLKITNGSSTGLPFTLENLERKPQQRTVYVYLAWRTWAGCCRWPVLSSSF
jgi:hypothetical protein